MQVTGLDRFIQADRLSALVLLGEGVLLLLAVLVASVVLGALYSRWVRGG